MVPRPALAEMLEAAERIATGTWKPVKLSIPKASAAMEPMEPTVTAKKKSGMKMFPTSCAGLRTASRRERTVRK